MNFQAVEKIAAAILYEGYILYPYRPSAIKNRQRWNFGTLYPRDYAQAQRPQETFGLVAECLVTGDAVLDFRVRGLQLVRQQETVALTDPSLAWDEATEVVLDHSGLRVPDLVRTPFSLHPELTTADPSASLRCARDDKAYTVPDGTQSPPHTNNPALPCRAPLVPSLRDCVHSILDLPLGKSAARDDKEGVRDKPQIPPLRFAPVGMTKEEEWCVVTDASSCSFPAQLAPSLQVSIGAEKAGPDTYKLRLSVENVTPLSPAARRDDALPLALVSAHLLLGVTGGEFVSLLDPPERHLAAVGTCRNSGVFPVLVGDEPDRSMMLCSPIILYDYPKIAAESAGDFFDGTEMDEMLALRVLTLTDEEKQQMRGGDARARKILERTEALTSEAMLQTHGILRVEEWNPFAEEKAAPESVRILNTEVRAGDRVRLRPRKQADIFDMALDGQVAVVEAIEQDFEDRVQLAVVLDDDPGREFGMMRQPGHRFFFSPEEVEPV